MSKEKASYPRGYLSQSQEPSVCRQWIDGQWAEIEYKRPQYLINKAWSKKRKKKESKKKKKKYKNGSSFYESKAWKKLRAKVLKKYGRKCMFCGKTQGVIQVDHIKPRSKYPELELVFDNMQVLCKDCNMEKSNKHSTDYRDLPELDIWFEAEKHI